MSQVLQFLKFKVMKSVALEVLLSLQDTASTARFNPFDPRQEMLKNIFTTQIGRHNRGTSDRSSRSSFVPSEAKESRERRHSIASSMHAPPSPTRRERRNSVALSHWSALIWFDLARATGDRSRQPTGHRGSPDRKLKECFIDT